MSFSEKIKAIARECFEELDKVDFSHGFTHTQRVCRLAAKIGREEGADVEVLEAACLLHDICRKAEDEGKILDHAKEAARLAEDILNRVGFPKEKIDNVCHCIAAHRNNPENPTQTLEAKILQDADRLDALGAVDVARVIASALQSKKYSYPVYVDEPYEDNPKKDKSAIHYLIYKSKSPKRKPGAFNTKLGKKMAEGRFKYMVDYIDRFIKEWRGEI